MWYSVVMPLYSIFMITLPFWFIEKVGKHYKLRRAVAFVVLWSMAGILWVSTWNIDPPPKPPAPKANFHICVDESDMPWAIQPGETGNERED